MSDDKPFVGWLKDTHKVPAADTNRMADYNVVSECPICGGKSSNCSGCGGRKRFTAGDRNEFELRMRL